MIALCLQIYFARILDVTLSTIRTFYTLKGKTIFSSILSFFEVLIWFLVARQALNVDLDSLWIPISYSLGYATGILIGSFISNNFIKGIENVTIITKKKNDILINTLRNNGFGISIIDLKNDFDNVKKQMLIIEVDKRYLKKLIKIVKSIDKEAFISISETKQIENGVLKINK
ncbi:MAG: DUF5698 domain-containing protein [bacterium]|nr:DUF5698 domain-containing protein [bacterium]